VKTLAALAVLVLLLPAVGGCGGGESSFSVEEVQRAFATQGVALQPLWAEIDDDHVDLIARTPAARPPTFVGVFDDAATAKLVVRGSKQWDRVYTTISFAEDPEPIEVQEFKTPRLRRERNVVVDYDAADRRVAGRIEVALQRLAGS
jgi:hypothetical protein